MRTKLLLYPVLLGVSASFLALSPQEPAAEQQAAEDFDYVKLVTKAGSGMRAAIVKVEGDRVRLRQPALGGSALMWKPVADFTTRSQYIIKRETCREQNPGDLVACSEFALENDLLNEAKQSLVYAGKVARQLGLKQPDRELMARAIRVLHGILRGLVAKGKAGSARNIVRPVVTNPHSYLSDEEKHALLALIEEEVAKRAAARTRERESKKAATADAAQAAKRERLLKPVRTRLDLAEKRRRQALRSSKQPTQSARKLKSAAKQFEQVRKSCANLERKHGNDPELVAGSRELAMRARDGWKDSLLGGASFDLVRGNYNRATDAVNRILAEEPGDTEALHMRARIEVAANSWDWGGRRIVR